MAEPGPANIRKVTPCIPKAWWFHICFFGRIRLQQWEAFPNDNTSPQWYHESKRIPGAKTDCHWFLWIFESTDGFSTGSSFAGEDIDDWLIWSARIKILEAWDAQNLDLSSPLTTQQPKVSYFSKCIKKISSNCTCQALFRLLLKRFHVFFF